MRFSARSKVGIILSIVTILTIVSGFLVMTLSSRGTASHAAAQTQTFHGHGGQIHAKSGHAAHFVKHARPAVTKALLKHGHPSQVRSGHTRANTKLKTNAHASTVSAAELVSLPHTNTSEGGLLQNFAGLNNIDNFFFNAGSLPEPPDQALCVGTSSAFSAAPETVVFEAVNDVIAVFDTSGTLLGEENLSTFFSTPFALGDPKCTYDTSTGTFYFTELDSNLATFSGIDVAVFNSTDVLPPPTALYFIDMTFPPTSVNGTTPTNPFCIAVGGCFGDQPHIGLDTNAFYISTDEFDLATQSVSDGASLLILSKEQLQHEASVVEIDNFEALSLGAVPIRTLQPAVNTSSSGTEYLLNSFPLTPSGAPQLAENHLGLWTVKHDAEVTTGDFAAVTLEGTTIKVETYAFPTAILSTFGTALAFGTYDDRMMQVQGIKDTRTGHIDLWAALGSAVSIPGDPVTRDGIAWFKIDAKAQSVLQQGFVASAGKYLVYPSIMHTVEGSSDIVFTITSPALDPSVAFVRRLAGQRNFGGLKITGLGIDFYNGTRWGDYSAATLDPNGKDVWIAGEFVNLNDLLLPNNWSTQVSEVKGDH